MPATDHLDNATFGVEFECYLPEGATQQSAAAAIAHRLAMPCHVESYGHITPRDHWKIVTDGSLSDYRRGMELVSPVLRGEDGLRQIERAAEALADFGCTINKKCGLHVHVGARDQSLQFFKNIVRIYGIYEPIIDAMMPASRRASANLYCRSMTSTPPIALDRATTMAQVMDAATHGAAVHEKRYFKVNLQSYDRHRTVEFRQHGGTLQGHKARAWTVLCLKMVAAAKRADLVLSSSSNGPSLNQARPGTKAHQIGQMMMRPEGVTVREVASAMNWQSVSLPQVARQCGLQFTTQRTGRETRYFAVVAAAAPQTEISISGFASFIGASDAERQFIEQRTNDLRGSIAWAA